MFTERVVTPKGQRKECDSFDDGYEYFGGIDQLSIAGGDAMV